MKKLHKLNFFCWSEFNKERNIDFHSYVWVREKGNIIIDPLPLSEHDEEHLLSLGKVLAIIITNSDHIRNSKKLSEKTGAEIWCPEGEKESININCSKWLKNGDKPIENLEVLTVNGSKTQGELALLIEQDTLITGDLIRAHEGGKLCILPDPKLKNKNEAIESVKMLSKIKGINAVLTGDGWPIFRNGSEILNELTNSLS